MREEVSECPEFAYAVQEEGLLQADEGRRELKELQHPGCQMNDDLSLLSLLLGHRPDHENC